MQINLQKSETGGKNAAKRNNKTRSPKERAQDIYEHKKSAYITFYSRKLPVNRI